MWFIPRKKTKPEYSKTVNQLGRMGRIPLDDAVPCYLWEIHGKDGRNIVTTVYFKLDDTRPMTEEEHELFSADPKSFCQKYADHYTELLRQQDEEEKAQRMKQIKAQSKQTENE